MNVDHSRTAVARDRIFAHVNHPVLLSRRRIDRDVVHISGTHQIIKGNRELLPIGRVLVDKFSHLVEVVLQDRLSRFELDVLIRSYRHRCKYDDDGHNHHELEQCEPASSDER